MTEPD
jgi:hypothetical protein